MNKNELVKKVSEILGVPMSHWDHCQYTEHPNNRKEKLKSPTCATVYSHKFGMWNFMICQDMTVLIPFPFSIVEGTSEMIDKFKSMEKDELKDLIKTIENSLEKYNAQNYFLNEAKEFLLRNNGIEILASKFLKKEPI